MHQGVRAPAQLRPPVRPAMLSRLWPLPRSRAAQASVWPRGDAAVPRRSRRGRLQGGLPQASARGLRARLPARVRGGVPRRVPGARRQGRVELPAPAHGEARVQQRAAHGAVPRALRREASLRPRLPFALQRLHGAGRGRRRWRRRWQRAPSRAVLLRVLAAPALRARLRGAAPVLGAVPALREEVRDPVRAQHLRVAVRRALRPLH